jgi:hypothetical protein
MAAPASSDIAHLLTLRAVRERAELVFQAAKEGSLNSFEYDAQRMPAVAEYVIGIISVRAEPQPSPSIAYLC